MRHPEFENVIWEWLLITVKTFSVMNSITRSPVSQITDASQICSQRHDCRWLLQPSYRVSVGMYGLTYILFTSKGYAYGTIKVIWVSHSCTSSTTLINSPHQAGLAQLLAQTFFFLQQTRWFACWYKYRVQFKKDSWNIKMKHKWCNHPVSVSLACWTSRL